jgi:putative tributyrin esterase
MNPNHVNSTTKPQDRYEDYIVKDLITDVEQKFPVAQTQDERAIVGISIGGFGAIVLGLKHPELFAFVGGMSPAIDVPTRPFSTSGGASGPSLEVGMASTSAKTIAMCSHAPLMPQRPHTSFSLVATRKSCCRQTESLLGLERGPGFQYEFHVVPGGHDWNQWNAEFPEVYRVLYHHLGAAAHVRTR